MPVDLSIENPWGGPGCVFLHTVDASDRYRGNDSR